MGSKAGGVMYRLKNGWKAMDKKGELKRSGELIELNKQDIARLFKLDAIESVEVHIEKEEAETEKEDPEQA
jgi:hypothetical protein